MTLGRSIGGAAEYLVIPALALVAALIAFGIFVACFGKDPVDLYFYMYQGAFGTWFSWQNTLTRAAPLILTALCTALPAQLGMVIIGGEGALLIGALAATGAALALPSMPPLVVQLAMVRAAKIVGLGVGKLIMTICFLAGASAGLAGMVEVAAVQGRTNANLAAGYGFTGILVAFLARQNPLAIIPVAVLLGGVSASGGLLQRRLGLPDASVQVLQGIIFAFVLASDALYGRIGFLKGKS